MPGRGVEVGSAKQSGQQGSLPRAQSFGILMKEFLGSPFNARHSFAEIRSIYVDSEYWLLGKSHSDIPAQPNCIQVVVTHPP